MSMETGSTAAPPRPVEKSGGATPKAQSAASDDAGAAGGPTFLSLLTAMEPDAAVPADGDAAAASVAASAAAGAQDPAPPALLPPDAAALLAQNLSRGKLADTDAAVLAGQGGLAGVPAQIAALTVAAEAARALGAAGHVAYGTEKFNRKAEAADADGKPAGFATRADLAADGVATTAQAGSWQHAANTQAMLKRADAGRAAQETGGLPPTKGTEAGADASRREADLVNTDWRSTVAAQSTNAPVAGAPMADVLAAFSRGAANARTERSSLRPLFAPAGSALAGSWAEQGSTGGNMANGATFAPTAAAPVPETAVAEKLNYWISRGVQNAELQLDAFGGGSVKVSIAVQGNEAQVEFRSDQPEARKLLQDAMPQLRDMLRGEGLELAGGFVGTSARQEPGARERRNNPQGVRSTVVNIEAPAAAGTAGLSRATGRTVDLFV